MRRTLRIILAAAIITGVAVFAVASRYSLGWRVAWLQVDAYPGGVTFALWNDTAFQAWCQFEGGQPVFGHIVILTLRAADVRAVHFPWPLVGLAFGLVALPVFLATRPRKKGQAFPVETEWRQGATSKQARCPPP